MTRESDLYKKNHQTNNKGYDMKTYKLVAVPIGNKKKQKNNVSPRIPSDKISPKFI